MSMCTVVTRPPEIKIERKDIVSFVEIVMVQLVYMYYVNCAWYLWGQCLKNCQVKEVLSTFSKHDDLKCSFLHMLDRKVLKCNMLGLHKTLIGAFCNSSML